MKTLGLFISFLLPISLFSQSNVGQIEILGADLLEFDEAYGNVQRCKGNVRFKQGTVLMNCDSAWFYEDKNQVEAFGNIHIYQRDTFDLRGEYLKYDGDSKKALVKDNVRLTDNEMILETDVLNYDVENKIGFYTVGGKIKNGKDRLRSQIGRYYSRSKSFFFKDSVFLKNPEYTMSCDTLKYNTVNKTAHFFGPTEIQSEENTILCNYGWYDTENNTSEFSNRAEIIGEENRLSADSLWYNRNTGVGKARGNITLIDSNENVTITGQNGYYNRVSKKTLITEDAVAVKSATDGDLYLSADSLLDLVDSNGRRLLSAYRNAKIFKEDLQAVADSLLYSFTDSTITLFDDPIMWTDSSQITGDTIVIFQNENGVEKLKVLANSFVAEKDVNGFFNQIKGKQITAYFNNKKLNRIFVDGNGQSLYYALEDSNTYSGVEDIICSKMMIRMDTTNKIDNITFIGDPELTVYPIEDLPKSRERVPGYKWLPQQRPKQSDFTSPQLRKSSEFKTVLPVILEESLPPTKD